MLYFAILISKRLILMSLNSCSVNQWTGFYMIRTSARKELKISSWLKNRFKHCVKSVLIQSYSGPHFPAFWLNTERYSLSLRIQSECENMRNRITPNTVTFYAVIRIGLIPYVQWRLYRNLVRDNLQILFLILGEYKQIMRKTLVFWWFQGK